VVAELSRGLRDVVVALILTHRLRTHHVFRNSTARTTGTSDGQCFSIHMIGYRSERIVIVQFVSRRLGHV
jgi:hypothetical protein